MWVICRESLDTGKVEFRGYMGKVVWTEEPNFFTIGYSKLMTLQKEMKRQCRDKRYRYFAEVVDAGH
jgi:hypothetical protein